ncbi:MAG: hypothetical protein ABR936_07340 [Bacteroidota bacterium]
MIRYKSIVIGGVLCCIIAIMAGCASSKLVDIWHNSSFQPPPLNKMLVISVSKDSVYRYNWEEAFSAELAKHDVAATPSYRLFPDAVPDTNQIIQIVQSNNFDGILVYRRLLSETETKFKQGFEMSENNVVYDRFTKRFVASYFRDEDYAAHVDSQKVDLRAIDVWTTRNEGQMIWHATSKTPEPNSIQKVRSEIVKLVMSELTRHGIIASERKEK